MSAWSVLVAADRYAAERLYHHDVLELAGHPRPGEEPGPGVEPGPGIAPGDRVALVADVEPPIVFALAYVEKVHGGADDPGADSGDETDGALVLTYTHRFFDQPRPATDLPGDGGPIPAAVFAALARDVRPEPSRTWLVSLDLPIEAVSAAEAVRQFWTYARELGPAELPAFVSPIDDELAMQAFVLGDEANQDPEED